MAIELNHTIVPARDPKASARFLAGILGIEVGAPVSHFTPVTLDNQVTLDYDHADEVIPHHYAFAVSGAEFEAAFGRIRDAGITYLLYDPFILRYKDDPRFAAFCRKVGLPVPGEASAHKST